MRSNEILTAIVHGMKKQEPSNHVRLAATTALFNSLEFTKSNFDNEVVFLHPLRNTSLGNFFEIKITVGVKLDQFRFSGLNTKQNISKPVLSFPTFPNYPNLLQTVTFSCQI